MSILNGLSLTNTFSDLLTEKNLFAVARPAGILVELTQYMSPEAVPSGSCSDQQWEEMVSNCVKNIVIDDAPLTGGLFHMEIESLVEDISAKVSAHIQHARSAVRPLVVSLAQEYETYLNTVKVKDPTSDFCICSVKPSSILADQMLIEELRYMEGRAVKAPEKLPASLGNLPFEQLLEMLEQSPSAASAGVRDWILSKPEHWLESLWVQLFCAGEVGNDCTDSNLCFGNVDFLALLPAEAAEASLALYLWAKALHANPDIYSSKESLASVKSRFVNIADFAAAVCLDAIKKIALANSTSALVIKYNEPTRTLFVNGDVYTNWLEKGGSPEAILGMAATGNIYDNADVIMSKSAEFEKAWNQYVMVYQSKEKNNRHLYSRTVLLELFNKSLSTFVEDEKNVRLAESYFAANRYKKAAEYVESLTTTELEDVYKVCLHLVAKIRFDYTSAYEILCDIQSAGEAVETIDVREAALLATINYLGDFLAQHISLKGV